MKTYRLDTMTYSQASEIIENASYVDIFVEFGRAPDSSVICSYVRVSKASALKALREAFARHIKSDTPYNKVQALASGGVQIG